MTEYRNFGLIFLKESKLVFRWSLSFLQSTGDEENVCIVSPQFRMLDTSWYLALYPNGHVRYQSKGWIGLFLHRADAGLSKRIKYTLRIIHTNIETSYEGIDTFSTINTSSGQQLFLSRMLIKPEVDGLYRLNITCGIKVDSINSLQDFPNGVSCAIQTEIPDSVPCAVQTEIPDSVSRATQTEMPDSSRALQTEVPDSVIDKENSKDGSSLDTKEVTILRDRMNDLSINLSNQDVTICVQDMKFRAHRNTLMACSPVFAKMLNHDKKENNTGTICIGDCDPDTFGDFLLYVYSGKMANLTPTKALTLYYIADKYDFPVLKEHCVGLLKRSLSITSICDVVLLAAKHGEEELLDMASAFFAQNMDKILVSVPWQKFMTQNPVEANELYIKSMKILLPRK